MRDKYIVYPKLDDAGFREFVRDHMLDLHRLRQEVLSHIVKNAGAMDDSEVKTITEAIMHVPLVYLQERYNYIKAKPEADRIASQLKTDKESKEGSQTP